MAHAINSATLTPTMILQDVRSAGDDGLASVQMAVDTVQRCLESAGGSFLQVSALMLQVDMPAPACSQILLYVPADYCESCYAVDAAQARCDEKGFLAVTAFGLPGRTHEDSAARGLSAALAIVQGLQVHVRQWYCKLSFSSSVI